MELLNKINLRETDTLYILGDILDRGPNPIKVLLKLMKMPNVICLVGNHEIMALECLEFLNKKITKESIEKVDLKTVENLITWQISGGKTTIEEFYKLKPKTREYVIDFIKDFIVYEELTIDDNDYLLVHGGLGNYSAEKDIEDYSLKELVWNRADYKIRYFEDVYVVTGHTPTQEIEENPNPGYIYWTNNHIAIDCGAYFLEGRLAAICLDTGEEFYSSVNNRKR